MSSKLHFYDNTELSCHKLCPRKYYFRHELGMVRDWDGMGSAALAFGLAWHSAMDVIWQAICTHKEKDNKKVLAAAYTAWEDKWAEEKMPRAHELDSDLRKELKARTPDTALEMLDSYIAERRTFLECKVEALVAVEKPFAVPIYPDNDSVWYCGRLDKVVKMEGKIYIIDHKTTSAYRRSGGFAPNFLDSFSPNSQVDGYAYAGHLLWPEEWGGVWIDGALVHSEARHFCWVSAARSIDALDGWLHYTREEIKRIVRYREELEILDQRLPFMPSFPTYDRACFDYNSPCAYLDVCKSLPNPRAFFQKHGLPPEYIVKRWSPFDVNQMETLGFKPDEVEKG